jgi:TonB family protein
MRGTLKNGSVKKEYEVLDSDEEIKNGFYREYAADETMVMQGYYLNNKRNGLWKYYFNGTIKSEETYKDDIEVGEKREYDLVGNLISITNFNNDGDLEGDFKIFNIENICITDGKFLKSKINGKLTYYYDDGKTRCTAFYINGTPVDTAWSYYPSGNKMAYKLFDHGNITLIEGYYEDGKIQFQSNLLDTIDYKYEKKYFYKNGQVEISSIENDSLVFEIQNYSKDGLKLDNGNYKNGNGIMKSYNEDTLLSEINYREYKKDGLAIYYYSNGNKKESAFYKDNKQDGDWYNYKTDGSLDYIGKRRETKYQVINKADMDYTDIQPTFRGGIMSLMKYLQKSIRYPSLARENGLEGKVIIKFSVKMFGNVSEVSILKDNVGGGCADESIRVVKNMPLWYPAFKFGFPVKTYYTLPVTFKLQ